VRWVQALPQVVEHAVRQAAAVPPDVAVAEEAVPLDAEAVAAVLQDAAAVAAVRDAAAVGAEPAEGAAAAAEPGRAGPGALPSGLPWAWACRQDPLPPWPAPPRSALTARGMEWSPIAWP
jgi:hypothetical protein